MTGYAQQRATAREEAHSLPRMAYASRIAEATAADLSGLTVDAVDLRRAADKIFQALQNNDVRRAAGTLRAWASMALAMVGRIEWSLSYQQGVADAVAALNAHVETEPTPQDTAGYKRPGVKPYVRDCGSYGMLTLSQMADKAGCTEAAMRQRLRTGWSPEQAIAAGERVIRRWRTMPEAKRSDMRSGNGHQSTPSNGA